MNVSNEPDEPMTFESVLMICAADREFVEQFDRLTGCNLSRRGAGLDLAIDDAAGRLAVEAPKFAAFVLEFIWLRLPVTG